MDPSLTKGHLNFHVKIARTYKDFYLEGTEIATVFYGTKENILRCNNISLTISLLMFTDMFYPIPWKNYIKRNSLSLTMT